MNLQKHYIILWNFFLSLLCAHSNADLEVHKNETGNGTDGLIKEDPIAEILEHDTMAFFAVLFMLCMFLYI